MLRQRTTHDNGVQYELSCDGCGAAFHAAPRVHRDAQALWTAAGRGGWVRLKEPAGAGFRCRHCATGRTATVANLTR